ncbi:hypothetical protein OVA14_10590 [Agrococcus sp. SL85]|uniref:hypothetical protein n=1 Tax=Agrococcus sp. SL85 TaxID=2995141 RepID=UPI00226D1C0E|nr:hypothetical protein [Agrococcus sp. SL85]WAC65765.1 hypothetical protein OVA14_10590 [Agrococcus sp. SL85]
MSETPSGYLDRSAAAARVDRSERTIFRWVERGEITAIMGLFRETDLLEVDRTMRLRRGRPGKPRGQSKPELQLGGMAGAEGHGPLAVADEAAEDVVDALRDLMFVLEDVENGTVELPAHYAVALTDARLVLSRLAELVPDAAESLAA